MQKLDGHGHWFKCKRKTCGIRFFSATGKCPYCGAKGERE